MRVFAIFTVLAIASVPAQPTTPPPCDTTLLLPLLTDPSLIQCTADSGLSLPPTAASLTAEVLEKACKSTACNTLITKVRGLNVGDCSIAGFKIETDLLTPLKTACAAAGGSGAGSSAGATPAAAQEDTPAATKTMPSPAPTPTPTPVKTSGAGDTLSATASATAVAVAVAIAALW